MDQFDKARLRYERKTGLVDQVMGMGRRETLHLPKPKTPTKRTNEIEMIIYVDGEVIHLTARLRLHDVLSSQRTRQGLASMLREALASKFGKVDIA